MRRTTAGLACAAALVLSVSCDSGEDAPAPATFLEGVWTGCRPTDTDFGILDVATTLSVWRDGYQLDRVAHGDTADGTCGGNGYLLDAVNGTFTVGAEVQATLDDRTVPARAIDLLERRSRARSYGIAWVDAAAEPEVLYLSELATSEAARPAVLDDGAPLRWIAP